MHKIEQFEQTFGYIDVARLKRRLKREREERMPDALEHGLSYRMPSRLKSELNCRARARQNVIRMPVAGLGAISQSTEIFSERMPSKSTETIVTLSET